MGSSYLRLNVVVCGVNPSNEEIIDRLFPQTIEENKKQLERKDDKLLYTARIFRGQATSENNLERIKEYLNQNFDHFQNERNIIAKNVVLYFSDENMTLQQNSDEWVNFANNLNTFSELRLPFIIFLSYGEIDEIRSYVQGENRDIFRDFQDKRKITILRLLRNENEHNRELNYRKILSYLWEITQILNQKPFKPSKNPTTTIKILLTGFSRKGKSTFINMIFDKMVTLENPSFIPVTSEIIEFLLPGQPDENGIVKGGLKLFDVPGLIEGTTENMSNIEKLIRQSIENQEFNYDVINYI